VPAEASYQQVAAALRRRIESGELAPGARFPSRHQIAAQLGVSLAAAQRALQVLRADGLIEGAQRHQPTVAHPPAVRTLTDAIAPWPHGTGERALARVTAPAEVAELLGSRRVERERVEHLDPDGRTSHMLTRYTGRLRPAPGRHDVAGTSGRLAAAGEAGMLGVAIGSVLLVVRVIRYSRGGPPAVVEELLLPADRWQVRLT